MPQDRYGIAVILNAGSGTGTSDAVREQVEGLIRASGREVVITVANGDQIGGAVKAALDGGASVVVAGGGDGTVNAVATELVDGAIPLGILPLGTLNHFARDLGIPLGLEEAIHVVLAGKTKWVDVGEVNDRIFLNNSSLGLYPSIVRLRERRPAHGVMKWTVALGATVKALRHNQILEVDLKVDGQEMSRATPIVFVGNNEYKMKGFQAGTRESIDRGLLALYVVNTTGRMAQIKLAWRVLLGTAEQAAELDVIRTSGASVRSRRRHLHVSYDGEVAEMRSPIKYQVRPAALPVCVP